MEKDLKLNSQVCTSVEQSKRLLKLGVKPETADCYSREEEYGFSNWIGKPSLTTDIPAWSLHRLIEMYNSVGDGSLLQFEDITYKLLINCICMAIATGSFPKQYLNE